MKNSKYMIVKIYINERYGYFNDNENMFTIELNNNLKLTKCEINDDFIYITLNDLILRKSIELVFIDNEVVSNLINITKNKIEINWSAVKVETLINEYKKDTGFFDIDVEYSDTKNLNKSQSNIIILPINERYKRLLKFQSIYVLSLPTNKNV